MAVLPQTVGSAPAVENELSESQFVLPRIHSSIRIPALDGLRGVAILLVLVCHSVFEAFRPSTKLLTGLVIAGRLTWSGVDLFFVLSGFLIGGILLDAKSSPNYFKTFYIRRAYRILPMYAVLLTLFSLRYISPRGLAAFASSSIPWAAYATFTQNFWMATIGGLGAPSMAATWSLAVEEQFYLTIPFFIRKINRLRLTYVLLSVVIAAPVLRTVLNFGFDHAQTACFVLTLCRADALSLGVLCAILVRSDRSWKFVLSHRSVLRSATMILALGLIPLTILDQRLNTPIVTVGFSWLAFFYTAILLVTITQASSTFLRVLDSSILRQLGVLAYATYLLHNPCMEACGRLFARLGYPNDGVQHLAGLLGVAIALAIAKLSWKYFETPLLRRGHNYTY